MSHRISICAHQARADAAHNLFDKTGAAHMAMDDGHIGAGWNHRRCWTYLKRNPEPWSVVLEEDALPVDGFDTQLERALAAAPTPIVSLYLGTGYPQHFQPRIDLARHNANRTNASWLLSTDLLHAVGVAIRTDLLPSMLDTTPTNLPIDEAIGQWAKNNGHAVGYTWPSLIDHDDDTPSVIRKRADGVERTQPRKAWWCHTRREWTDRTVDL